MSAKILAVALLGGIFQSQSPSQCLHQCQLTETGLTLIQQFEGYSPHAYDDVAGKMTIGYGHLIRPGEKFKEPLLPHEAAELLRKDVASTERSVKKSVKVLLWPWQFDALTSWTFNLGSGSLRSSTMLKRVNAELHDLVPDQIRRWNRAGGKVVRGLVIRREAEALLYDGDY